MTEIKRRVNGACEQIMASGHIRLYRDLYKDLREWMPCGEACRLIEAGLRLTRLHPAAGHTFGLTAALVRRSQAIAALRRLARYADVLEWGECCGLYDGADRGM